MPMIASCGMRVCWWTRERARAREGEDRRAQEGEAEREEIGGAGVQVVAHEIGHGGAQGGDLR
jgi:hypothetical protein